MPAGIHIWIIYIIRSLYRAIGAMLNARVRQTASIRRQIRQSRSTTVQAMGFFNLSSIFGSSATTSSRGCELAPKEAPAGLKLATFAGGCFWGIELAYQRVPGVITTSVGYTGGKDTSPTYDAVCSGSTGHTEAIQCVYDPKEVTYDKLLDVFFDKTDPTTLNRQGNDRGTQYRSGIYYHDEEQRATATARFAAINKALAEGKREGKMKSWSGNKVVAELEAAGDYYLAEKYHQQYLAKGGRMGQAQSAAKGCTDPIRCYG